MPRLLCDTDRGIISWLSYPKPRPKIYFLPIAINIITIIISILLYQFENAYPDYAFHKYFSSYENVVNMIESKQVTMNERGVVILPQEYDELFRKNVIFSRDEKDVLTVYLEDGYDNSDNLSWGYLYRSDGKGPTREDDCYDWRKIVPPTPNWYYCIHHRFVGFPDYMKFGNSKQKTIVPY